jgi:hypothetical protein
MAFIVLYKKEKLELNLKKHLFTSNLAYYQKTAYQLTAHFSYSRYKVLGSTLNRSNSWVVHVFYQISDYSTKFVKHTILKSK